VDFAKPVKEDLVLEFNMLEVNPRNTEQLERLAPDIKVTTDQVRDVLLYEVLIDITHIRICQIKAASKNLQL